MKKKTKYIKTSKFLKKLGLLFFLIIFFKLIIGDLYYVPTDSMEYTIDANSYVIVSKIHYGAKLPRSTYEIPYLSKVFKKITPIKLWKNTRVYGFNKIKRNDIVLAENQWFKIIKRVTAIYGDTIKIENGFLSINSNNEVIEDTYKLKYRLKLNKNEVDGLKSKMNLSFQGRGKFDVTFNGGLCEEIKGKEKKAIKNSNEQKIYPQSMDSVWNRNNYGKLIIPYKGMKIKLTAYSYNIYKEVLELYENVLLTSNNNSYHINGKEENEYVFKNNYYFLMGDNRMNSIDSRFFGFIPENLIYGKVIHWF